MNRTTPKTPSPHPKKRTFLQRFGRVVYETVRGFIEDDCYAKASALTFYSLLSIVPILAVFFGIAKGFGFEKTLETDLMEKFSDQGELTQQLIQFANSWLQTVKGGLIAGVGVVMLLWSVIGLLNNVEAALNSIWKVKVSRSYNRKISDYLTIMIVAPLFLVTSSSVTLFISANITKNTEKNVFIDLLGPVVLFLIQLFPFVLIWVLFILLYLFMPNTKVLFRTAFVAGILAGSAFQIWQWAYIKFQISAASYGAIYGSFAAFPLFLIWLQISWMIALAGAELAVQLENDIFIPNGRLEPLSIKTAALYITYRCIESFTKGESPLTDKELSRELGISLQQIHSIIDSLLNFRILSKATFTNKTYGYQPARPIQLIKMKTVCDAIDNSQTLLALVNDSAAMAGIRSYLQTTSHLLEDSKVDHPVYPMYTERDSKIGF